MIRPTVLPILSFCMLLVAASAAPAASTPEQRCQKARYQAAAKYMACEQKQLATMLGGSDPTKSQAALGKCQAKYTAMWAKLQIKVSDSTCATGRFVDHGTTVTDNLTGLQWEKKTDDGTVHDKDDVYQWSGTPDDAANGPAFTSFLSALNAGGCFAAQCDWRLPTFYELQTILSAPPYCGMEPCIDPVFGPTVVDFYWSGTSVSELPNYAWIVAFDGGNVVGGYDGKHDYVAVRAVRGGL